MQGPSFDLNPGYHAVDGQTGPLGSLRFVAVSVGLNRVAVFNDVLDV